MRILKSIFNLTMALALAIMPISINSNATVGSGDSTAIIVEQIVITTVDALNFGKISAGTTIGTVAIDKATGNRTPSGGLNLVALGSLHKKGVVKIKGLAGAAFQVNNPPTSATLTNTTGSGAETMNVNAFDLSATSGNLDGSGEALINVGATLNVGANQVPGTYDGTYPIEVIYN